MSYFVPTLILVSQSTYDIGSTNNRNAIKIDKAGRSDRITFINKLPIEKEVLVDCIVKLAVLMNNRRSGIIANIRHAQYSEMPYTNKESKIQQITYGSNMFTHHKMIWTHKQVEEERVMQFL